MASSSFEPDFSRYEFCKVSRAGKVLTITLSEPDKLNAITARGHREMGRIFLDAAEDEQSEVIVVTGAGRAFSAGGDLDMIQLNHDSPTDLHRGLREAKRFAFTILDCDKPVIAKVNGDAIGLGATLALFCDVVFAADTARFGDPHNRVALIAGDGGQVTWPQLIGFARAKHYLFTGDLIPAPEAQAIGLIHKSVPADKLDAEVDAYVQRLLAMPIQSVRWTKQTLNIPLKQLAHSMMDAGVAYEGLGAATDDNQEAINAFRGRRKPVFKHR
jgi:enoyl-CoA hydratase